MTDERDRSGVEYTGSATFASSLWSGMPEAIARESRGLARLRNLSTPWRTALALAGLGVLAVVVWVALGRVDRPALPRVEFWLRWLPGALLAVYCARSLLWPAYRRRTAAWLPPVLLLASVALPLASTVLPELHRDHPASLAGAGSDLVPRALACSGVGLLFGTACLAWVVLFLQGPRGLAALPPSAWALFVVGQSALLALHCPLTAPIHLALGHGSLGVLVLAVVWALRRQSRLVDG